MRCGKSGQEEWPMDYGMYRKAEECMRRDFEGTRSYDAYDSH